MRVALALLIALTVPLAAHAGDLTPPESLVIQGAPPVPSEIAAAVGRYRRARGADLDAWSPRRRELVLTTMFGDTAQLHRVRMPGGDRRQLTFYDDSIGGGVSWEPHSGHSIIYLKDVGGDGNQQIYCLDTRTETSTLVTDGRSRNGAGIWANRGKRVVYTSTRRNGEDTDLYLVEPVHPSTDRLVAQLEGGGWTPLAWSPDDRRVLLEDRPSINESSLWLLDLPSGKKTPAFPRGRAATSRSWVGGLFSGDDAIVTTSAALSEFRELARVDLATGSITRLSRHIPWDVLEFDLSSDRKWAAVVTNEAGVYTLHVLDAATGRERHLPKLPAGYVTSVHWRPNSQELGFRFRAVGHRRLFDRLRHERSLALDAQRGRHRHLGLPRAGADPLAQLRRPQHQRLPLQAARAISRQASRADLHSRRPRGAVHAVLHGIVELLPR